MNDIAIIGITGRYPRARDLRVLWKLLRDGEDCITEIPPDRWNHQLYFHTDGEQPNKTSCKWGGFIEGVDEFDPLFFGIPPSDAQRMEPQTRIFLEQTWELLEAAGYTRDTLREKYRSEVGLYIGMVAKPCKSDLNLAEVRELHKQSLESIADTVASFFGLRGPSILIDAQCASSAMAIHLACKDLNAGNCQMNIAGGINLLLEPEKYVGLSAAKLIGTHCDSRSFAEADGYLPAEGVGAVLLKTLDRARDDGDEILGVIKGSRASHCGRRNFDPGKLSELMEVNLADSGIEPLTVNYIEASANGSPIGDAMEVAAINNVLQKLTCAEGVCAIGSVKSNLGHCEGASGIAQLTKVILQLQHRELAPSIRADPINRNLRFRGTSLRLQSQLAQWHRTRMRVGDADVEIPRRALINSFAAGGSCVNMIVEEFTQQRSWKAPSTESPLGCKWLIVLSARSLQRLAVLVEEFLSYVKEAQELDLVEIAHTLQMRREAMEARLALVVSSKQELLTGLHEFLAAVAERREPARTAVIVACQSLRTGMPRGRASNSQEQATLRALLAAKNFAEVATHWVRGACVPWEVLYEGVALGAVRLPTYPFAREKLK